MNDNQNQSQSGSINPVAQAVNDALRKSGTKSWLGFPSAEEMEKARAEKAERDFEAMKRRSEQKAREMDALKQGVRDAIQRSRDEQR